MKKKPAAAPEPATNHETPAHDDQVDTRPKRGARPNRPLGVVTEFGTRPHGTTHWKIRRIAPDGAKEILGAARAGSGVEARRFPIDLLSEDTIRTWWGAGTYEVEFMGPRNGRTCGHLSWGEQVSLAGGPEASPRAPAAPAAPAIDPLAMFATMRQLSRDESDQIEARVNGQITAIATLAQAIATNQSVQHQAAATQANAQLATALGQIASTLSALEGRISALEGGDEEDDEGDDEDDEDDDEEEDEPDSFEKAAAFVEKYGPMVQAAIEMLSAKKAELPAATVAPAT